MNRLYCYKNLLSKEIAKERPKAITKR